MTEIWLQDVQIVRCAIPNRAPLPHCVAERGKSASENDVAPVAPGRRLIQSNAAEDSALKRHECRDPKDGVAERKAQPFRHCAAEREARERSSQCGFSPSPIAKAVSGEFSLSWTCPTSNNQKQL